MVISICGKVFSNTYVLYNKDLLFISYAVWRNLQYKLSITYENTLCFLRV